MGIDVRVERTISRSPEAVAAFAMDPAHDTCWISGVVEAKPVGEVAVGKGSRVARVAKFLGRRIEYVNEVVEYEPPSRLVMKSVEGPFPMKVTYSFQPIDGDATLAGVRVEGDAGGFFRLASPLLGGMVKRSLRRDLAALKNALEQEARVTGTG